MTRGVGGHSLANIMKHLKGIHFPCTKRELVLHAGCTEGPDTDKVVLSLQNLPDQIYHSPAEIIIAMSRRSP